jgi:hypothetical protein
MLKPGNSSYWAEDRHRARRYRDLRNGAVAGLLGGVSIMVFFLGYDALFFGPLATPNFLAGTFIGKDVSALVQLRGAPIVLFSVLHLAVFVGLGIMLEELLRMMKAGGSLLFGGFYGLTICTTLFWVVLHLSGVELLVEPRWVAVMLGNFLAGAVMGSYLKIRTVLQG